MHIIIGLITAIAGLLWALNSLQRAGFDLNSLNPFYWMRRRRWENMQVNPLYAIESPRELAALLLFAVTRQGGELTAEQKAHLLRVYSDDLKFDGTNATEMYTVASHLLNTDPNYMHKVADLIKPSEEARSAEQNASIVELVTAMAHWENVPNASQTLFVDEVTKALSGGK